MIVGYCSGGRQAYLAACSLRGVDAAIDCYCGGVVAKPEEPTPRQPVAPIELTKDLQCPLPVRLMPTAHSTCCSSIGINHIDTAARCGDSELRIGPGMARHRKDFFLATKTGSRTAPEAREDLHRSLDRRRVDDLVQLHPLGHPDDWVQAIAPDCALEAPIEAHEEGLARFIGVTGHGWTIGAMHRRSLARFDFDAVLLPYNSLMAQQERYRRNFKEVLDVCRERNVAVQVIKSIARGPWATAARTHTTWYQPLRSRRTSTARSTGSSACRASSSTPPAT